MVFGITDQEIAVWHEKHSMRASQFASLDLSSITVKSFFPCPADDGRDDAGSHIDFADRMVLRIGNVDGFSGFDRDSFGPSQPSLDGRSAISGESPLSGSRDVVDFSRFPVDFPNAVSFPEDDPDILAINGQRPGAGEWLFRGDCPIGWHFSFSSSTYGSDNSGFEIEFTNSLVLKIRDKQLIAVERDTVSLVESRDVSRAIVSGKSRLTCAGNSGPCS